MSQNNILRFPYVPMTDPFGQVALRPLIPMQLAGHQATIAVTGLIDSGSDICVLPYGLGLDLGATWASQPLLGTLSGNLKGYEARGILLQATLGMLPPVELAFAWIQADHMPLILGQVTFFSEFDICFHRSQRFFEIGLKGSIP